MMLQRWIPLICVPVLVVAGLAIFADSAEAGRLRNRCRRGCDDCCAPTTCCKTTCTTCQTCCKPATSCQTCCKPTACCQPVACCDTVKGVAYAPTAISQPAMAMSQEQSGYYYYGSRRAARRGWSTFVPSSSYYVAQAGMNPQPKGYVSQYRLPTPQAPEGTVLLNIRIPNDAKVWFDGTETKQTGEFRQFVSEPLTPGKSYTYMVKAQWTENGKQVVRTRKITVHANELVQIDMLQPTPEELPAKEVKE